MGYHRTFWRVLDDDTMSKETEESKQSPWCPWPPSWHMQRRSLDIESIRSEDRSGSVDCYVQTTPLTQIHRTASFLFDSLTPHTIAHVRYDLTTSFTVSCTIWSGNLFQYLLYDINLGATHTTIPSTRGVTIYISLVSSAMDSIRRCVAVFKAVPIPTSDLKSEFLCQSSSIAQKPDRKSVV